MTHVVLVGLMGVGKTTVGRRVAAALGRRLSDSDALIEANTGRTVREIWLTDGEPAFREFESAALDKALADPVPGVIAAAGGVVLSQRNRDCLRAADAVVIWLRADVDVLVARAIRGTHRPLLDDDPEAALRVMAATREVLYREVADVVIDVGEHSVDEVVDLVLAAVEHDPHHD